MTQQLKEQSNWLRANAPMMGREVRVDREANVIRGYVVALEGSFANKDRGAFDMQSLKDMRAIYNKEKLGLKSRFAHPTLSGDGLGKFLGRSKDASIEPIEIKGVLTHALRADLHFNQTALEEPPGGGKPLGIYIMDLAESDPDALSSSLVVGNYKKIEQLDPVTKRPKVDEEGNPLGPIWRPTELHASDVVDTGEAVRGFLSASVDGLPDDVVRQASAMLSSAFPGASRDVIRARVGSWLDTYLSYRFGDEDDTPAELRKEEADGLRWRIDAMKRKLRLLEA